MTEFTVNIRTDAFKTDINLVFTTTNFPLLLVDAAHKLLPYRVKGEFYVQCPPIFFFVKANMLKSIGPLHDPVT